MDRFVFDQVREPFGVSHEDGPPVELRAFTHGLPPLAVSTSLQRFYEDWRDRGVDAWNEVTQPDLFLVGDESTSERQRSVGWWNLPEVLGDRFIARLLNAPQGTCIMLPNATTIVQQILSCKELNLPQRRKVVTTEGEFSAVCHSLHHFNEQFDHYPSSVRNEVQLQIAAIPFEHGFDLKSLVDQIDASTALVVLSHVGFLTGELVSDDAIRAIVQKAHAHGALVAIDGYHAIGSHCIDVTDLGVDLYFGGLLKEGCGSSGNGFLYVRPELDLHPTRGGWFGDRDSFEFDQCPHPHPSVRRRFLSGTTPIAPFYHGMEGLKIFLSVGIEALVKDIRAKAFAIIQDLDASHIPLVSPRDPDRHAAMVILGVEEADRFRDYLAERLQVYVDARQNRFIRLAPHVYHSPEQIQYAVRAIIDAFQVGDYKTFPFKMKSGPVT